MIIKYIEEEYNFDGTELVRNNKKFRNEWKWLTYFTNNCSPSLSFVKKMDEVLKDQFNNKLGKEIDWSQVWLFIEPIGNQLSLCQFTEDNRKFYILICRLRYEKKMISYRGRIMWADKRDFREFDYGKDVSDMDIHFEWIPDEDNDLETMAQFPSIHDKESRLKSKKLKIKAKFPVFSVLDSMPHEGKFAITLWNTEDTEKVSTSLEKARSDWNKQTDNAKETGDESLERGYCHDITFDGLDGKVGFWYVDSGSAHDGIHEFLLQGLSESGIKIKHVEIQGL